MPIIAISGLALALLPAYALAADLRITIQGIRSLSGTVLVGLYDSESSFDRAIALSSKEGFLNDSMRVGGTALRANPDATASAVFTGLRPGTYAVILFHDENENGRLDTNFWGVPIEPYGFSNDAQGSLGPPSFKKAAFTIAAEDKSIDVNLVYHGNRARAGRQKQ
jgi:uncharacterized protein (DUF2141 family)